MYSEFYGFSAQPFNVTPDPEFLFFTESHREALTAMKYGVVERKGFILVSGEVGTGKTTLIHQLLQDLGKGVKVVFISQTKSITFEQLLREILLQLGLPAGYQDKTFLVHQLNLYLMEKLSREENLAIIIDEAQHLDFNTLEELRLLSNLETASSKLLQIVLVGQPELEEKLNSWDVRQLKQRIVIQRRILPLRDEDSRRYIEHRLKMVGSSTSQVFTPDALSMICSYGKGIPRVINVLCDNAFLIGCARAKKKIDSLIVQEVVANREDSSPQKPLERKVGHKRRLPLKSQKFKGVVSKISYIAGVLLVIVLTVFVGREFMRKIPEGVPLAPPPQLAPQDQKITVPPAEIQSSETPSAAPAPSVEEKQKAPDSPSPSDVPAAIPAPPKPEVRTNIVTVEEGGFLSALSQRYYNRSNTTLVDYILKWNPEIINPDMVLKNQKIKIPEITEESLIIPEPDGNCKVHVATFLQPQSAKPYENEPVLKGKKIEVIPHQFPDGKIWYRVMAGKFASREEGLRAVQALRGKGLLPYFK